MAPRAAREKSSGKGRARDGGRGGTAGRTESADGHGKAEPASPAERWYTISEAAEHLGVSEPTIYRWMKEGTLSFFKVGGATRFSREGLDAVIEKTTGRKEAEAAAGRCASCGHNVLVGGRLQGSGRLYFKPQKTRFWVFAESTVGLSAKVCTACGFVQIHADTEKLKRLRPKERK